MTETFQVITTFLLIIEVGIAAALGVAVFTTPPATLVHLPLLGPVVTSLVIVSLVITLIAHLRKPSSKLSPTRVFIITFATQFILFLPGIRPETAIPVSLLLTLIVGSISRRYAFIIPCLIFYLAPALRTIGAMLPNRQFPDTQTLQALLLHEPLFGLYLFLSGLLPILFRGSSGARTPSPKAVIPPEQTGFLPPESSPAEPENNTGTSTDPLADYGKNVNEREVDDLLASVVYFMSRNFRSFSSLGFIYLPTEQTFVLNSFQSKSVSIIQGVRIPLGSGIIGKVGNEKRSFMTGDLGVYNAHLDYYGSEEHVNSLLAVPIVSEQNELLGTLVLDSKNHQAFKDNDKDTLKRFSSLAAALITTSRMRSVQERNARTFQTFYEVSHQFTTIIKPEQIFAVLFNVIPPIAPCNRMLGIIFDQERKQGQVTNVWGQSTEIAPGFRFPINAGLYSFVFQKRRQISIGDFQQYTDKYYRFTPNETANPSIRSLLIFPILDDEQRCRGLFSIESQHPDLFTPATEQILGTLMENASVAFIRAVLYQQMERFATTDGLTGLNNHRNFQELLAQEIERSRRYRRPLALLLMDIDHFKGFNDTYGHPVGDLVLKEISACIQRSIRLNDLSARYGGEEFVVIVPETDEKGALITAERIRSTIEQHTIISLDRQLKVTVSIGCSAFPESAPSQQALIDTADKALYAAKEGGRNRVVQYKNGIM